MNRKQQIEEAKKVAMNEAMKVMMKNVANDAVNDVMKVVTNLHTFRSFHSENLKRLEIELRIALPSRTVTNSVVNPFRGTAFDVNQ